ncbi:MAG: hypothetical protein WCS31_03465 [Verrucomicrobiae bacterium]
MTAQIHEYLRLDGKSCRMACEPDLPESAPGLTSHEQMKSISSRCWRGYVGYWEVANNRFYLRKVVGSIQGRFRPSIFAEWYSGIIRIPQGEMLEYIHSEYASIYEADLFLEIEKGIVTRRWIQKNEIADCMIEGLKDPPPPERKRYLP